jgi:peroxiredoxin
MGHRLSLLERFFVAWNATVLLVITSGCSGSAVEARGPGDLAEVALEPLPEVAVTTLAGEPAQVGHVAEGRAALVSLWATWCEACDKEMDALNRLHDGTHAGRDAVVIGVAVGEDAKRVAAFAQRRGLRYPQLVDAGFAFADAIGQRRLPATLVVDRQGRIVYRGDALDAHALEALRRAIAKP